MSVQEWRYGCTECDKARTLVRRARKDIAGLHELRARDEARIRELSRTIQFLERELHRASGVEK